MKFLSMCRAVALTALLSIAALPAMAQSLTTMFAHDNGSAGNMFDVVPNTDLTIDAFDINVGDYATTGGGAGDLVTVSVYWRVGPSSAAYTTSDGWNLLGTVEVTAAGANLPTRVPLGGLALEAGQTYGIYIDTHGYFSGAKGLLYTNGGPTDFSNEDLLLTTFVGKGSGGFGAGTFMYRQWNGTVHYTTAPTTTCASEGYTGTKLEWCKNICERGYTGSTLAMWIRRWTDRYRTLPYCALEPQPVPTVR